MPTRPRFFRTCALGTLALALALPAGSALAATPLPFTPGLGRAIDEAFFAPDGRLSADKIAAYRERLEQRHREVYSLVVAHHLDRGRKAKSARKRANKKKIRRLYEHITRKGGWIDQLADADDPIRARRIAARLLEFDRALLSPEERPHSLEVIDYLLWLTTKPWDVPTRSRPDEADREASNLAVPGRPDTFYEPADLRRLIEAGTDLSLLDPPRDSTFWRDPGAIARRDVLEATQGGGDAVHEGLRARFPERARLDKIRKTQTKPKFTLDVGKGRRSYKLKLGGEIHSEPTANGLLATLGFNIDINRHVRNFRIDLDHDFDVDHLRKEWRSYFEGHRTHLSYSFDDHLEEGQDEQGRFLLAKAGVLEERRRLVERVGPWNFGDLGNEGRREVRALLIFSSWIRNIDLKEYANNKIALRADRRAPQLYHIHHDLGHSLGGLLPEKPNPFSWNWARKRWNGDLRLDSYAAQPNSMRGRITWADARWMGRRIGQLTRSQIEAAVAYGGWPEPVARLLVEKLIERRNDMMESLELVGEATPSGAIRLLPVDRGLTTPDGAVVDGRLEQGRFPETTLEFAEYWEALLDPIFEKGLLAAVGLLQSSVGQVVELVFDDRSVGTPRGIVAELVIQLRRDVEANPHPRSHYDYFIARDVVRLGVRLGAGIVARGEATFWRQYTLLHPVGTEWEARFARDTILDLLLPRSAARGELPERYVLLRETLIEGRARGITDDLSGGALPVGAEVAFGRARIRREVVARDGARLRVFDDVTVRDEASYRAFAKAVFVRIPVLDGGAARGRVAGELFVLDDALAGDRETTETALRETLRTGSTESLRTIAPGHSVHSRFRERSVWVGILDILYGTRWSRVDELVITSPGKPGTEPAPPRHLWQYAGASTRGWNFIDFGESSRASLHALAPDDPAQPAVVELRFLEDDLDVWEYELENGYVAFANRLADPLPARAPARKSRLEAEERLLPFTPSLHGYGDRWGHLRSETVFATNDVGIEALASLEPGAFWKALAADPFVAPSDVARARRALAEPHPVRRRVRLRRLPSQFGRIVHRGHWALHHLRRAGESSERRERLGRVTDALEAAIFRSGPTWDPAVLGALRRAAGPDDFSVDVRIAPPPWRENILPGRIPAVGATHSEPHRTPHGPILLNPLGAIDEYRMLERLTAAVTGRRDAAERASAIDDASSDEGDDEEGGPESEREAEPSARAGDAPAPAASGAQTGGSKDAPRGARLVPATDPGEKTHDDRPR